MPSKRCRTIWIQTVPGIFAIVLAASHAAAGVVVSENLSTVSAFWNDGTGYEFESFNQRWSSTEIPGNYELSAGTVDAQSTMQLIYSSTSGGAALSHQFSQSHAGGAWVGTQAGVSIVFTVDQDMAYQLIGNFAVFGGQGGASLLESTLSEVLGFDSNGFFTGLQTLSYSHRIHHIPAGAADQEVMTLPEGTPDTDSLQGILYAGRTYIWSASALIDGRPIPTDLAMTGSATASGELTLNLSELPAGSTPVPEPDALVIFGLGSLLAAGAARRR